MSSSESPAGIAQIGVTGLAVMGSNIARNFARHGYTVAVHNRSVAKTDALLKEHSSDGKFVRSETIPEFLAALEKPRRVLIMVKAGEATDAVINELADAMEPGDMAAMRCTPTPCAARKRCVSGACTSSGPGSPAAKRAR